MQGIRQPGRGKDGKFVSNKDSAPPTVSSNAHESFKDQIKREVREELQQEAREQELAQTTADLQEKVAELEQRLEESEAERAKLEELQQEQEQAKQERAERDFDGVCYVPQKVIDGDLVAVSAEGEMYLAHAVLARPSTDFFGNKKQREPEEEAHGKCFLSSDSIGPGEPVPCRLTDGTTLLTVAMVKGSPDVEQPKDSRFIAKRSRKAVLVATDSKDRQLGGWSDDNEEAFRAYLLAKRLSSGEGENSSPGSIVIEEAA